MIDLWLKFKQLFINWHRPSQSDKQNDSFHRWYTKFEIHKMMYVKSSTTASSPKHVHRPHSSERRLKKLYGWNPISVTNPPLWIFFGDKYFTFMSTVLKNVRSSRHSTRQRQWNTKKQKEKTRPNKRQLFCTYLVLCSSNTCVGNGVRRYARLAKTCLTVALLWPVVVLLCYHVPFFLLRICTSWTS